MFTYTRLSDKQIRVDRNGQFAGWLDRSRHKPTGLHREAYFIWSGAIAGVNISATSVRSAKAKIAVIPTTIERMTPGQIFSTEAAAQAKIADCLASLDPGERTYKIVAEVTGWSIDCYDRDGNYRCTL